MINLQYLFDKALARNIIVYDDMHKGLSRRLIALCKTVYRTSYKAKIHTIYTFPGTLPNRPFFFFNKILFNKEIDKVKCLGVQIIEHEQINDFEEFFAKSNEYYLRQDKPHLILCSGTDNNGILGMY